MNESIFEDLIQLFPNVPTNLYKFKSESLTERDKFFEIIELLNEIDSENNYWSENVIIASFILSAYQRGLITINELYEIIFNKKVINSLKFLYVIKDTLLSYRFKTKCEYADLLLSLLVIFNSNESNKDKNILSLIPATTIYPTDMDMCTKITTSLNEFIYYTIYMSDYEDKLNNEVEMIIKDDLKKAINNLDLYFNETTDRIYFALNSYVDEDFLILHYFLNEFEKPDINEYDFKNINTYRDIINLIYVERGYSND